MALFDLYVVKVFFDDGVNFKMRPVIQVKSDANSSNAFAVISSNTSRSGISELTIKDYKYAGLKKESNIRLSKRISNPTNLKYIGALSATDSAELSKKLLNAFKIENHKTEDLDDDFDMNFPILIEVKYE